MTTPRPKRAGFLANLSAAMTPPVAEDVDPSKPLAVPKTIKASMVLSLLGGLVFLFIGAYTLIALDSGINASVQAWNNQIVDCQAKVGGIGDKVVVPEAGSPNTDLATTCKQYRELTDADISSAKTQGTISGIVVAIMGVAAAVAGWYIRAGAKWAKRLLLAIVILAFAGTLLLGVSSPYLMVATLFLAVAVMLTFIGRGSGYFQLAEARRRAT